MTHRERWWHITDPGDLPHVHLQNNRLVAFKDLRFTYDDWGNLCEKSSTNGATQRFTYDCENRLIHAQTWHGATLHSEARYHYDALGRRIAKAVTQSGQTQDTTFLWQGLRLLQEQQPQRHSTYVYEPDSYAPLARIDTDPKLPEHPGPTYYFHTDQIGTPQEMTDAQGHVVWRAYYKAWGGLEALSPNTVEQNLRFQGQYHDRESGLYYNTFRYYDPAVGRFTTQDPIGLAGGENLYRYAPNALGWVDPLGLTACSVKFSKNFEGKLKKHAQDIYMTSRRLGVPVAKGDVAGKKNFILSIVNDSGNLANPNFKWNTIESMRVYVKDKAVILVNNSTNEITTFLHRDRISSFLQEVIK
ncbi:RHS domain-containing protein [Pseudomonas protegens]|nr:RHS domain-containing protein [Pseudomonas protegens]